MAGFEHRLFTPDADILGRAALLAGMLCGVRGHAGDARLKAPRDCTLFMQAQKLGLTILTANLAEFDVFPQPIPADRVRFYRVDG